MIKSSRQTAAKHVYNHGKVLITNRLLRRHEYTITDADLQINYHTNLASGTQYKNCGSLAHEFSQVSRVKSVAQTAEILPVRDASDAK